ncbi:girdin-like isoform X7 [Mytilus californianus]|uniref:girdin-like isoform X7 n=1 Tax=Mytilus californianus TaxID=6549 RepID=UPI0022451681|nr:girdin-like isoform X7 [Mytilus californianus]
MASCASFMESPLVLWVETFANGRSIEFQDLHDGIFLNKVLQQIDSRPVYDNVNDTVDDMNSRLQNWDILIRNIKSFYVDALQQILIVKLPNFQQICKEPEKEASFSEIKKVLLLILGCAIQCDKKENFIDTIKSLDVHVQHEIVELIKEVTDDTEFIMHIEPTEQLETYTEKMFNHVTRLLKERDDYFEILTELAQERDFYQAQIRGNTALPLTTPTSPEKHHMVVELADCKAKIRKLRQELEDKQELISDLQVDQDDNKGIVSKLKNENATLIQDARAARLLRDELDILREKVAQSNSYQTELTKCKEKLNELEFYKSRVNELREDNAILTETKNILEEQLSTSHKRVETVIELENELMRYRQQVEEMTLERDADREKIRILTEDNAQLQFEKKSNMNESTNLEHELESARLKISGIGGTLSDQMAETTNAKVLRLDLENQRLKKKIEELRDSSLIENTSLNLELEKENQRLAKKIEKLQGSSNDSSQQCIDLEQNLHVAARERDNLVQTLETLKDNYERQVRELEAENDNLQQTVHVIRQRNEQTNDTRLKELEKENKQLHETVTAKNQVTSKLEHENRQIQKSFSKLKLNSDHINELETENSQFEKENSELRKNIATLQLICDKSEVLEQENSDLEVENRKLQKSVQTLKSALQKKESLEQENINLTVENKKLERSLHSMKSASSRIAELESEKDSQNREIQQLRKSLENQRNQRTKQEQMELDLLDLDNENQRIQKSLEVTTKRLNQLEKDNTDLEVENEKLQKAMEEMKMSSKRLHNVEKESSELENEVSKLQTSKAVLEKENKRLKQSVQLKDTTVDELTTKCNIMEREHRSVKRTLETQKETSSKLHEFERENREILQQSNINKKTIATLREELVNEKIKSQQLSNELEKLNGELERVGINKEKLVMAEHSQDDNRYKALENMMEEALVKNMEIKEDKILSLQSRLDESKNRNVRLQEELRILKRECESLKQRYEEESVGSERHGTKVTYHGPLGALRNTHISQNNPTKDILDLKDHLVNLERTNATLMTENKNMKSHTDSLNQQIQKLDRHNCQLQSQTVSLQEQNSSFQSQIAKLQVEYSTLQAQCSSLQGQCQLLQNQLNRVESEHQHLIQTHEELQTTHEQLVGDHEDLQRLHEQLSSEHEALISQHGSLKSLHKSLKNENRELTIRLQERNGNSYGMSVQEKEKINADLQSFESLKMEYNHMREKHDIVYNQHEKIRKDYLDLSKEHKQLKTDYNSLRGTCDDYKNQLHEMELELSNLGNKYDSLYQANQKMEDDNKNLLMQVQALLNTNSELLTQILNSKDTIAEEQKSYLERLSDLRRQKERLEEKIMEAYKRQETQKKNKGLGARIARKAAKIFVSKNQRSKSRNNLTDLSADNTSHGSNEITENGDSAKKSGLGRPANLGDDEDDDGGFGNRNDNNEMLTLEQFLSESSKTSNHSRGNKSENREDLESKSSENSDNSVNRRRRQAPNPPSDNRISIPDVVSQSQIELNLSRMSRISAGSSGSGYESRPDSLDQSTPPQSKRDHPETSTPAYNNINNIRKFEEAGYSPLVKPDFRKHSLGSTPSTASRTLQYVYPSPYKSPQNRELPPTPNDTPSDRLDRLAGFSQSHNSSNSSSLYSNNQDNSVQYDQSIRSGPTSRYRSGSPVRSNQTFSPVVQQGRPPSSASHHNSSPQTNGQLPPSGPLMRGQSLNRPQTFHESQQNNIYFSIDDNKQNENRPENHYARVQRIERPKSVPPNMFEALQNQENMNNRPKDMHNVSKGTPPKPPPRRSREPPLTTGRVSLLREPGANRSGGRQLPQADTYRSSTPTLRKDTPPRQVPVNEEPPKDPKANSVWYEYGCV